jgi:general secretion pathway protein J
MRYPGSPRAVVSGRGFTLLEVLLALVVFAGLSMTAYQVMQGVLKNDEITREKVDRLADVQRAVSTLERDFTQIIPRATRVNGETSKVVFQAVRYQMESDDWSAIFVRGGWLNPGGMLVRSQLQKVGYRLRENKLERLSYLYLDPVIGTEPTVTTVLEKVEGFKLRFHNGTQWVDEWTSTATVPFGIEVELKLQDYGKIRRVFLIPAEKKS